MVGRDGARTQHSASQSHASSSIRTPTEWLHLLVSQESTRSACARRLLRNIGCWIDRSVVLFGARSLVSCSWVRPAGGHPARAELACVITLPCMPLGFSL